MTFFGTTEYFSGRTGALRWSILVGKQKHNVQKPSLLLLNGMHKWRPKMYSFVSVLTLKKHFFCVFSIQTRLVRPHLCIRSMTVNQNGLRFHYVVTFHCNFVISHFYIFMTMIPKNSGLIAENPGRTWEGGGGGGRVRGCSGGLIEPLN